MKRNETDCRGTAPITAALAVRLERAFGATAEFWMSRQQHHDLHVERQRHDDTRYDADDGSALGPVDDRGSGPLGY